MALDPPSDLDSARLTLPSRALLITVGSDATINGNYNSLDASGNATEITLTEGFIIKLGNLMITKNPEAGALGDPYIYHLNSKIPLKLPDKNATYRLFELNDSYINAEVKIASKNHQQRMLNYAKSLGVNTKYLVTDGYFFSKFYINVRGEKIYVDSSKRSIITTKNAENFFKINVNNKKY